MKHCAPAILVLALLFLLCIWNSASMTGRADHLRGQLDQAEQLARAEDWEGACQLLRESHGDWTADRTLLRVISTHDLLDEAEALYRRSLAFAGNRDGSEFLADLSSLRAQLFLLAEREQPRLSNIF